MTRIVLLILMSAGVMLAQSHGYVFVAPGVASNSGNSAGLIHLGVGGEAILPMGIGAGAELGFLGRTSLDALGSLSLNGYYHFKRGGYWKPFATAGYSNFFTFTGHSNLANIGGGVNYWYKDHMGIKLEVLDHFSSGTNSANYLEFRFGFDFK
ncbi:MAG: hypothetical protein LAP61_07360 [Acidobacteriia bacterium]|nr:hypothetical protein [Terriglobia bacterium]